MLALLAAICLITFSIVLFGQTDRGTITGTVSDPARAVVPNASVAAKSVETGAVYAGGSSNTGNYALAQLPSEGTTCR